MEHKYKFYIASTLEIVSSFPVLELTGGFINKSNTHGQ